MNGIDRFTATLESHPVTTVLAALGALAVALGAVRAGRSVRRRGVSGEQVGTLVAAAIATGVSAQGMWVFFDKSLHLTLSLRVMFFAFLEIMVLTSALRARSAQQVSGSAGIDGIAMWVLTCLSAVLAATDADNIGTVLIRLSAPLVAAWGWERSMALERRRSGGLGGINWRITPERMLIRLGLADPTGRTAGEAAMQRRLIDVALAADRARTLRETGAGSRRVTRARRRLQRVMRRAVEDGGLVDNGRAPRAVLLDNLRILSSTGALLDLDLPNPWTADEPGPHTPPAAITGPQAGQPAPSDRHEESSQSPEPHDLSAAATTPATAPRQAAAGQHPTVPAPSVASSTTPTSAAPTQTAPGTTQPAQPAAPAPAEEPAAQRPTAPAVAKSTPTPPGRQFRRDPAVRDRVRELRAAGTPTTGIAAELGTSPRTISRILADLDDESTTTQQIPVRPIAARNPAQTAVSSWHNGFRVLPGGNGVEAGPGTAPAVADDHPQHRTDRSIEN